MERAVEVATSIGYPVVVRPSYVLGGRAMAIVDDEAALRRYMVEAVAVSMDKPILIDQFLEDAFEVDVDAICDGERVVVGGIMQHIEEAGIHSGDSACVLPPYKISNYHLNIIREYTEKLGMALGVRGLMNVQYAIKDDVVYVLEVNPRASRTVPFVSKATGVPLAKIAAKVMAGMTLAELGLTAEPELDGFFVKEAVLPWKKFTGIDTILGPEMRSTGEVMGHAARFGHAFAKSQLGANTGLPLEGGVLITVNDFDKGGALKIARDLHRLGFQLYATSGTGEFIHRVGIPVTILEKAITGAEGYTTLDAMRDGKIDLIINTPLGPHSREDGAKIRTLATRREIPLITTLSAAQAAVNGIQALRHQDLTVRSLQEHYAAQAAQSLSPRPNARHFGAGAPGAESSPRCRTDVIAPPCFTDSLRRLDHGKVAVHRHIVRNRVARPQCVAIGRVAEATSLLDHIRHDDVRRVLAQDVHVDAAQQADAVAIARNPLVEGRDGVLVGMLRPDAQRDHVVHDRENLAARMPQERLARVADQADDARILGDDVLADRRGRHQRARLEAQVIAKATDGVAARIPLQERRPQVQPSGRRSCDRGRRTAPGRPPACRRDAGSRPGPR